MPVATRSDAPMRVGERLDTADPGRYMQHCGSRRSFVVHWPPQKVGRDFVYEYYSRLKTCSCHSNSIEAGAFSD